MVISKTNMSAILLGSNDGKTYDLKNKRKLHLFRDLHRGKLNVCTKCCTRRYVSKDFQKSFLASTQAACFTFEW